MIVQEPEWRGMTIEERVDSLRVHLLAQEALVSALIQGLRSAGINVVIRGEPGESDRPRE